VNNELLSNDSVFLGESLALSVDGSLPLAMGGRTSWMTTALHGWVYTMTRRVANGFSREDVLALTGGGWRLLMQVTASVALSADVISWQLAAIVLSRMAVWLFERSPEVRVGLNRRKRCLAPRQTLLRFTRLLSVSFCRWYSVGGGTRRRQLSRGSLGVHRSSCDFCYSRWEGSNWWRALMWLQGTRLWARPLALSADGSHSGGRGSRG
jgi:hypothetical protein